MENTPPPNTTKPEDPVRITNGVLKLRPPPPLPCGVYKECLKNHAASMGGHAVDGCGEFMPSPTSSPSDPTSLRCAACGCHRNFHRRDTEQVTVTSPALAIVPPLIEYHPTHRHHPPQPQQTPRSPNSPSPPPISSTYYPSAPHMLLALSNPNHNPNHNHNPSPNSNSNSRKRFRTKFTQVQKDKMYELAERLGWKMQRKDEDIINDFCNSIGVEKGVFKVWMHNNKNTLGVKKEVHSSSTNNNNNGIGNGNGNGNGLGIGINLENVPMGSEYQGYRNSDEVASGHGNNNMNGSSSSSRD